MTDRPKIPAEAVELYTQFIHGEISRRAFVSGVKGFAVAGLTSGALIEALMPKYAEAQQIRDDDNRIKATWETVPSPDGNGYIRGYLVRPFSADTRTATPAKLPGVIVIHENRGLNPHTLDVARRFALENFNAAGEWREQEGFGYKGRIQSNDPKVDASSEMPDGTKIVGVAGLQAAMLKQEDLFFKCLVEKLLTYALGRELGLADGPTVNAAVEYTKKNGRTLRALLRFVVTCEPFGSK